MSRWLATALSLTARLLAAEPAPNPIPLKPDPPFALDGELDDWSAVPGPIRVDRPGQATWGKVEWSGPADLSGTVRLAWRPEALFLAADVTDDQLRQSQRGAGIWQGDHVELYLDALPDLEPARDPFGAGQFQILFSPGNFLRTGDALTDCPPEAHAYQPPGLTADGVEVAAKRTPKGWTIEASVPWKLLGLDRPAVGTPLRVEVGLSDTDSADPRQECMLTTSPDPWAIRRGRLNPAVLAAADGTAPAVTSRVVLGPGATLERDKQQSYTFTPPPVPPGRDAVLAFQARLEFATVAGYHQGLRVTLNGQPLDGARLVGKPLRARSRGGQVYSLYAADHLATYYAPDFTSADLDAHYGLLDGVRACDFELRVTDLLKPGENTLTFENVCVPAVTNPLVVGEVRLETRMPPPPPKPKAGPPAGAIPTIVPAAEHRTRYELREAANGALELQVGGESFRIESRFSTPKPAWVTGSNSYFRLQRQIERRDELILVRESFTNLTDQNLPLMQRHEVLFGDRAKRVHVAGLEQPGKQGKASEPGNPTSFACTEKSGVGLLAVSDPFRIHVTSYALADRTGLADESLVVKPGATVTAEWALIPTAAPDYFAFVNAARRLLDVNFTLDGAFAFMRADPRLTGKWSDQQTADFIRLKDAKYVCSSIEYPTYKGRYTHGTAFQQVDQSERRNACALRRKLVPGVQNLVYFHCFIDVLDEGPQKFADSLLLRPDGKQADYGEDIYKIFMPLETNSYGPEIAKNIDVILNDIGAEGVYWDEHEYSRYLYHYGEPWDGCSADIDPQKLTISRLKSSVTLLTEAWRLKQMDRILAHGPLVGNGCPYTRAMTARHFPCFVETGSITHCANAQLYSPIALGDHLTERSEKDAYGTMLAALDYGCVYHWYNDVTVIPTHHTLTQYMYPITPLELHSGYVIGRERVVTKVSGLFGWGDGAAHEVHVYNDEGVEVPDFAAPTVKRDGQTFTELRIGEGWSAAIVRK
ncbi:MAG: hypothetical protein HYU66_23205 [Armatimonadetes bacterium]|nr:hypothetical protein [Armatimonadota bacterium]